MDEFKDKVAVVTGAASGIGRGLADRCVKEGMKVVLADVEGDPLAAAADKLRREGAEVLPVVTDVSRRGDLESLARKTVESFGAVHLLFNNAGVGAGGLLWECTLEDWQWVIGVNLGGLIYAIRVFIPLMLGQRTECHVVNTASLAGLVSGPGMGIYHATKHAIVSISETLYQELSLMRAGIGVSVICPGCVNTRMLEQERNRPLKLRNPPRTASPVQQSAERFLRQEMLNGMTPGQVAEKAFQAIRRKQLYVITHPETKAAIRRHMEDILEERNPPLSPMPQ